MHVEHLILNMEEISQDEKEFILKHTNECESCRKFYNAIINFENSIKSIKVLKAPKEIDDILIRRIQTDEIRHQMLILFFISIMFVMSLIIVFVLIQKLNVIFLILKIYTLISSLKLPKINDFQVIASLLSILIFSIISEFIIMRNLKFQKGG